MKQIRKLHFYLGVFFAPTIVFFAFTGLLQTFELHESHGDEAKPAWVQAFAQVHTHQRLSSGRPEGPRPDVRPPEALQGEASQAEPQRAGPPPASVGRLLMRLFAAAMALGLMMSSGLGVYMAFRFRYNPRLIVGLLVAGTLLPMLFLVL